MREELDFDPLTRTVSRGSAHVGFIKSYVGESGKKGVAYVPLQEPAPCLAAEEVSAILTFCQFALLQDKGEVDELNMRLKPETELWIHE